MPLPELREAAGRLLREQEPRRKCEAVLALLAARRAGAVTVDANGPPPGPEIGEPGRPQRPLLVPPAALPRRSVRTREGRAALLHALAHIEFNAIHLALDAVWRFSGLPEAFYDDWLTVAADEARHFAWLCARLGTLAAAYGDFPAHDGLWQAALATADDPLARMALVPRVLEARGLDVSPRLISELAAAGDAESAKVLGAILEEEVGHVAIGSRWFVFLCRARGLEPAATFASLLARTARGMLRGPLNREARLAAGFSEAELMAIEGVAQGGQRSSRTRISSASASPKSSRS